MYQILSLTENLNPYFDDIFNFCHQCELESELPQTLSNMGTKNWESNPESLLYRLYKTDKIVLLNLLYTKSEPKKLIALAGVEFSDASTKIALIAKRFFVLREHRCQHLFHDSILDYQLAWAKNNDLSAVVITVNEYQKNTVLKLFERNKKGRAILLGRSSHLEKYDKFVCYPEKVWLCNCWQYVLVLPLKKDGLDIFDSHYLNRAHAESNGPI